jgi:hypothetical protein
MHAQAQAQRSLEHFNIIICCSSCIISKPILFDTDSFFRLFLNASSDLFLNICKTCPNIQTNGNQTANVPISQDSLSGLEGAFASVPPCQVSVEEQIFSLYGLLATLIMNSSTSKVGLGAHIQHLDALRPQRFRHQGSKALRP